jgi:hypothetical protein
MSEVNDRRTLSFSNNWIESAVVSAAREIPVEDAIVVNLSPTVLRYRAAENQGTIAPWKSAALKGCTIESGETAALLRVRRRMNLGGVALGWDWYGSRNPQFPRGTPLYISAQDEIGVVQFDAASTQRYRLKLNLWYTPEETDCGIHRLHDFLEVHTQILGTGYMQKFRENNPETLYENVPMPPGFTHDPFFLAGAGSSFRYPWHRYYAETDCIWMAVELHPS